jgi:glucoamylase
VAAASTQAGRLPYESTSAPFFTQLCIAEQTGVAAAAQQLIDAGDRMLQAVICHSDHLQLSEQFDGTTGYEKSVRNLTWSYAAYLSAVRSRSTALGAPPSMTISI